MDLPMVNIHGKFIYNVGGISFKKQTKLHEIFQKYQITHT